MPSRFARWDIAQQRKRGEKRFFRNWLSVEQNWWDGNIRWVDYQDIMANMNRGRPSLHRFCLWYGTVHPRVENVRRYHLLYVDRKPDKLSTFKLANRLVGEA